MTDLGALNYFLRISVTRDSTSMFLSQKKYVLELLDKAHMANYNLTRTPVDTESKLGSDGNPISDPTLYRSFADGLQYLTFTRSDICLHMHDPREPHLAALKRREFCDMFMAHWTLGSNFMHLLQVLLSSAEAEYRGVANVVAETVWLRNFLRELHTPLLPATLVYCDNVRVRVLHVPSRYQYAGIFTKGLPSALFEEFRFSLSVRSSPAQTVEEC
ncbi:ribonuclease H-like domain-containing protein [Tanacetum coccineum]